MNKIRNYYNHKILFIGYLFAFFIIFNLIIGVNLLHAEMTYDEVSVKIPVSVSKDYGDSYENEIVLEPVEESYPLPESGVVNGKAVLEVNDNKNGHFEITFNEPGEYEYKIYERKGDNTSIEYDTKVYYATVFVMDNNGKLEYVLSTKIEGVNSKPDKIQFVNIEEEETTEEETTTEEEKTTEETTNKGGYDDQKGEHRDSPTTGDNFPLEIVLLIMFVSCSLIFALVIIKIRLNRAEEKDRKEIEDSAEEVDEEKDIDKEE